MVDIAVYTGAELPRRSFTPDKLVKMLPGLFGSKREVSEKKRLANIGQPMVESPVGVNHAAGIFDLKDWVNPLHGYHYDSMNEDALLTQPFNYKALVIPQRVMVSADAQKKITELRNQGIQIIDSPYQETHLSGLAPDVVLPEGIAFVHRTGNGQDYYFLANQTDQEQTFTPSFRQGEGAAVVYNPLTEERKPFYGEVTLPAYGSVFVCYGAIQFATDKKVSRDGQRVRTGQIESEPWDITFKESDVKLEDQQLFDWSQHSDDKVKYFSGHALYKTSFEYDKKLKKRAWLALPNVKDIAHVWVNGKDCGIAWTAPYEVEVTDALKKGKNKIEIEVVNTWHNALHGMDQGKAPYEGIWTNAKYRTKEGLIPAGLIAEPEIIIEH